MLAKINLRINLKSGLFSVAVYTPNSDPISDVHWLVRRKIGSAVRAKLVDIRTCIENDRLVTSLVYCAIYAQLLVLRALGGAPYRTGIILIVVRMAAPPATTSSALAHLVHRQWFIMHPWTRVDRWGDGGDASRRYLYTPVSITQADNECRLEGDKTHEIFHILSKKVGGGISYVVPTKLKSGGTRPPPVPHRSTPVIQAHHLALHHLHDLGLRELIVAYRPCGRHFWLQRGQEGIKGLSS